MMEVFYSEKDLVIECPEKKQIKFYTETLTVSVDGFDISHAGEYEKGGILCEVKAYGGALFYIFGVHGKRVCIVSSDTFEMKEEIIKFFGDVDVLIIIGTKAAAKVFENIEAKLVIPYGEGKDVFLNTLGQHTESVNRYKIKSELPLDATEFVNLEM